MLFRSVFIDQFCPSVSVAVHEIDSIYSDIKNLTGVYMAHVRYLSRKIQQRYTVRGYLKNHVASGSIDSLYRPIAAAAGLAKE